MLKKNYKNFINSVFIVIAFTVIISFVNYKFKTLSYQQILKNFNPEAISQLNKPANYNNPVNNPINQPVNSPINSPVKNLPNVPQKKMPEDPVKKDLLWGAYVGDNKNALSDLENLVGIRVDFYADFEGWDNSFPKDLLYTIGLDHKTLIIFWDPNFGYDQINDGSHDDYIKQFAKDAKSYSYPIILIPFSEMNLNEEAWGYGHNNNSATKFIIAWKHIHNLFANVPNVKFGLDYNHVSIPSVKGNLFSDYYPGDSYVDYVGVDGFSFNNDWKSFGDIFDNAMLQLATYNKPIIIFSLAADSNTKKADWIKEGLGTHIMTYKNLIGWVWFNQGGSPNWLLNSDDQSLAAIRSILKTYLIHYHL